MASSCGVGSGVGAGADVLAEELGGNGALLPSLPPPRIANSRMAIRAMMIRPIHAKMAMLFCRPLRFCGRRPGWGLGRAVSTAAASAAALAALALARGKHFCLILIVRVCVIQVAENIVRRLGHLRGKVVRAARLGLGRRLEGADVKARVLQGTGLAARRGRVKHTGFKGVAAKGLPVQALAAVFLAVKAV